MGFSWPTLRKDPKFIDVFKIESTMTILFASFYLDSIFILYMSICSHHPFAVFDTFSATWYYCIVVLLHRGILASWYSCIVIWLSSFVCIHALVICVETGCKKTVPFNKKVQHFPLTQANSSYSRRNRKIDKVTNVIFNKWSQQKAKNGYPVSEQKSIEVKRNYTDSNKTQHDVNLPLVLSKKGTYSCAKSRVCQVNPEIF